MNKERLIICLGILLLLLACKKVQQPVSVSSKSTKEQEIISQFGDTIPMGKAYKRKGKIIPLSLLPEPEIIPAQPIRTQLYDPPQQIQLSLVHSLPYPKGDTIFFGQNGIPKPYKLQFEVEKIKVRIPEADKAAPFFRKNKAKGAFDYLSIQQGLPSSLVYGIIEDKNGFIWIAHSVGLTRYDGKSFRHYSTEHGLEFEAIHSISIDHQGDIWLAQEYGSNTIRFDGKYFYKYNFNTKERLAFAQLYLDQDSINWFYTNNKWDHSLVKYDGTDFTVYNKKIGLNKSYNTKWIKNAAGEDLFNHSNTLSRFQDSSYVIHYNLDELSPNTLAPYTDKSGTIHFFIKDQICISNERTIDCFTAPILEEDKIKNVHFDEEYQLLIRHASGATSQVKGQTLSYIAEKDLKHYNFAPFKNSITINNQYWYNSWKAAAGIEKYNPRDFGLIDFAELLPTLKNTETMVSEIFEDSKNNLWLGMHNESTGLMLYDNASITQFKHHESKIGEGIIRSIFEDRDQNIWIGLEDKLLKYDGSQFIIYDLKTAFPAQLIRIIAIDQDKKGNIWIGTNKVGFGKFDGTNFTFYTNKDLGAHPRYNTNNTKTILSDRTGNIWIGSNGSGLVYYNTDTESFTYYSEKEGLCSNQIVSLYEDNQGVIWAGSIDKGLSKIVQGAERGSISFQNFNKKDGLTQNDVWTIHEGPEGHLWLGVDACLNVLFFEDEVARNNLATVTEYCDFSGQNSKEFFSNASLLDSKNQMWWGSTGDLLRIKPQSIKFNKETPKVFLDEIEINQQALDFSELSEAKAADKDFWIGKNKDQNLADISYSNIPAYFNYPQDLVLPHDFNTITFRLAATNAPDLSEVKFSYFLKGNDRSWSKPNPENKIDYRNLSPGSYTFNVKAIGKNAIWSKPFEYTFTIRPPWWQTWYAYLGYFILVAGGVYWFYRTNLNRRLELAETKRVKEIDALKTRLYTNITHEFRTPLTVIMGMNENIQDNEQEKKLIRRNSKNLLRLVNQLLDLSKLDSGNMKIDQIQEDIVFYLQFLTESFHSMAEEKNIRLTFYSEVDTLIMDYDEVKIQHIIYNLLSNAIKFTPGEGKIILHLSQEHEAGISQLRLKVIDTGIGIPENKIAHIFDRFYQVDGSYTRKGEGTGIGLALTKELIEMMDGSIEVISKEDKGTEFIVLLPIQNNAPKVQAQKYDAPFFEEKAKDFVPIIKHEEQLQVPIANEQYAAEILIIEDNVDVATYIEKLLFPNYKVHIAIDGQKGIDAAIELVPDMIISDVMMPEKDGYEVCQILKQDARTSHIPIIMLTAKASKSDKLQGLRIGADAYLTKPFDKTELLIRINQLVEIRRKLQEKYSSETFSAAQLKTTNQVKEAPDIEDTFIKEIRKVVEQHYYNTDFGVNDLAKAMFMSHTQIYRKLKALTGKTPSQFIRSIRLQKGKELLLNSELNVSEIAYEIGFADPSYFSRTFQQEYGKAPRDLRKKLK